MPGVAFEATERMIEAGQKLGGTPRPVPMIKVRVTDRNTIKPVVVGVRMLRSIYARHSADFTWRESAIDRLAGTRALREAVQSGTVDDLLARWDADAERFRQQSRKYWLYQ